MNEQREFSVKLAVYYVAVALVYLYIQMIGSSFEHLCSVCRILSAWATSSYNSPVMNVSLYNYTMCTSE